MLRRAFRLGSTTLIAAIIAAPMTATAQSAQTWSAQGSLLLAGAEIGNELVAGAGVEAQVRYTPPSLFSVGVGLQVTTHSSGPDDLTLTGVFVEPRFALDVGSDRVAPYLAGRLALLSETLNVSGSNGSPTGFGIGGGAGLLIRLSNRINLDAGAAFVSQSFGAAGNINSHSFVSYVVKGGISIGFGSK